MKIGWDGFSWLVRDLWQNKQDLFPNASENKSLPNKLIAVVSDSLDKNTILLHWEGRDIRCQVDIPVQKGEHHITFIRAGNGYKSTQ